MLNGSTNVIWEGNPALTVGRIVDPRAAHLLARSAESFVTHSQIYILDAISFALALNQSTAFSSYMI